MGERAFIARARRWRKMLGGGMRQAGLLAAAGIHALEYHVERLAEDHARARRLAAALEELPAFTLAGQPQTNMVMLNAAMPIEPLRDHLAERGVRISGHRWVTHLDFTDHDLERVVQACRDYRPGGMV